MGKSIYTYYKERLIEISGSNKCLYLKSALSKSAYDLGRLMEGRYAKIQELNDFIFKGAKGPLTLISRDEQNDILQNLAIHDRRGTFALINGASEGKSNGEHTAKDSHSRLIDKEISRLRELKREVEELERESGRYELYLGYPFVLGSIKQGPQKTQIRAPLLLIPVRIEAESDGTVNIIRDKSQRTCINPALIYAYAQSHRLSLEDFDPEQEDLENFRDIRSITDFLSDYGIEITPTDTDRLRAYGAFPDSDSAGRNLFAVNAAVLGRFSLSGSIHRDYKELERGRLTNEAIEELLRPRRRTKSKAKKEDAPSYTIKNLDFAQSEVVRRVGKSGNMVIYGPPGTGKSQTIVNIISDAMCKGRRVLVVSQKKAALDVVFNRLGLLNEKAIYISDEAKQKRAFYERCLNAHQHTLENPPSDIPELEKEYRELEKRLLCETEKLRSITDTLTKPRAFGLSLSEMYSSSENLSRSSVEYGIYMGLLENKRILKYDYPTLSSALFSIRSMNLARTYYSFMEEMEKNPLISTMKADLDVLTLTEVKERLESLQKSRRGYFNMDKHPYMRQVLAYYPEMKKERTVDKIAKLQRKIDFPRKLFRRGAERRIKEQILETYDAIEMHAKEYDCLHRVLSDDGYISVIDNVLRGNRSYVRLAIDAIDGYIAHRDIRNLISTLDNVQLEILDFAYSNAKSYSGYDSILDKLMGIRIYHEVLGLESTAADELALLVDYPNITAKILKLKSAEAELAYKLCAARVSKRYIRYYESAKEKKDYLYQISKNQKFWHIRKMTEVYGEFIMTLFPCWLLSPENVSGLLPLKRNLFDIVIFDEASQVFIENTLPAIYRGKSIVVAGDDKQLRPSSTFMKRYMGADPDEQEDYSMQAALEVESLLDLAVSRYESANLTYHYRSVHQELIDFSNYAFYNASLRIAPNLSRNSRQRPIERYKVPGCWIDRRNPVEAQKIAELVRDIFKTRKNRESIGIITFNSEQQSCIADAIDRLASADHAFREALAKERTRLEAGEDVSIFIKNLENVQGDERDIIIFSIGYAPAESGRVNTSFGSLSVDGGENRLNVAITRAKSKIIVVTSIEPEELQVENSKNQGPKLLRAYLTYVRAVAMGRDAEARAILNSLNNSELKASEAPTVALPSIEDQIKERLTRLGYEVDTALGNVSNRLSLAVYDKESDRYLVGVELDKDAILSSESYLERDVYKPSFLCSRGWSVIRVWCRDWWLSPGRVIKSITSAAESSKKQLKHK